MDWVLMQSPQGELREVEATTEALTPLMVAGWHQVPAPAASPVPVAQKPVVPTVEEK